MDRELASFFEDSDERLERDAPRRRGKENPMGSDNDLALAEKERQQEEQTALVVRGATALAAQQPALPPAAFKEALDAEVAKLKMLYAAIRETLIPGVDYGLIHAKYWDGSYYKGSDGRQKRSYRRCSREGEMSILGSDGVPMKCPECGAKHTCLKGGAEKVIRFLQVTPSFELDATTVVELKAAGITGWLPYVCRAIRATGEVVGEGRGAASIEKNDGDVNKAIKMAKKSALIDLALSFGLSSVFTQDIESPADYKHRGDPESAGAGQAGDSPASPGPAPGPAGPRRSVTDFVVSPDSQPLGNCEELQPESEWTEAQDGGMKKWFTIRGIEGRIYTTSDPKKHKWGPGDPLRGIVTEAKKSKKGWLYAVAMEVRLDKPKGAGAAKRPAEQGQAAGNEETGAAPAPLPPAGEAPADAYRDEAALRAMPIKELKRIAIAIRLPDEKALYDLWKKHFGETPTGALRSPVSCGDKDAESLVAFILEADVPY